jgi:hypothetical protein
MSDRRGVPGGGPTGGDRWRRIERRYYRPDGNQELTTVIVYAVANAEGVDPTDLDSTLHERIDAVALERVFFESDADGPPVTDPDGSVFEFRYADYLVRVRSDGRIDVFEATDRDASGLTRGGGRPRGTDPGTGTGTGTEAETARRIRSDGRGRGDERR